MPGLLFRGKELDIQPSSAQLVDERDHPPNQDWHRECEGWLVIVSWLAGQGRIGWLAN